MKLLFFLRLNVNRNKRGIVDWETKKHSKDKVEYTILISNPIKSLEMYLGHDSIECEKLDWEKKLSK